MAGARPTADQIETPEAEICGLLSKVRVADAKRGRRGGAPHQASQVSGCAQEEATMVHSIWARVVGELGLRGVRWGREVHPTRPGNAAARGLHGVHHNFAPQVPDHTVPARYLDPRTWPTAGYLELIIDAVDQRIMGWHATSRTGDLLVVDRLEWAVVLRCRTELADLAGVIHQGDNVEILGHSPFRIHGRVGAVAPRGP
jgi:hypothetical protein